jgi:hypothetical protein
MNKEIINQVFNDDTMVSVFEEFTEVICECCNDKDCSLAMKIGHFFKEIESLPVPTFVLKLKVIKELKKLAKGEQEETKQTKQNINYEEVKKMFDSGELDNMFKNNSDLLAQFKDYIYNKTNANTSK